jgi:hypothetical protein
MEKPIKRIVFDQELGLYRICWTLDSTCPGCGEDLENVFNTKPGKLEILEALVFPCEKCTRKLEKEYERESRNSKKSTKLSPLKPKCNQLHQKE